MKKAIIAVVVCFAQLYSWAQTESKAEDKGIKDKLFLGFVTAYYLDFVSSPLKIIDMSIKLDDGNGGYIQTPDTAVPFQTRYISFVSLGVEPRYNIKEFNENLSLAIAAPITVGFGQAFAQNDDVHGARGFGNIQAPLLLKLYAGSNATYASIADFGISAGAGLEYNKLSIIATEEDNRIVDANKGWFMPTFSASVHFWRGNSPIEVNFKYGRGNLQSYKVNKQGSALVDGERFTRANSIKLSFIYLFDF